MTNQRDRPLPPGLLRDGFALTPVGASEPFAHLAAEALRISLDGFYQN